jgi:hypothetical protein
MIRQVVLGLFVLVATAMNASAFPDTRCEDDESICLAVLGTSAKRSGERLSLRLGNGRRVSLKNYEPFGCHAPCYKYSLEGILSGFVIIRRMYQIGGEGILIRLQDGFKINLAGAAVSSETGRRFVVEPGPNSDSGPTRIYRFNGGKVEVEYTFPKHMERDNFMPYTWRGDDVVVVPCVNGQDGTTSETTISFADDQWTPQKSCN